MIHLLKPIGIIFLVFFSHVISEKDPLCLLPLPLSSPQFAQICRITTSLNLLGLLNPLGDQICDQDCRCIMGAQGGGKCGFSPVDNQIYCMCDYNPSAANPSFLSDVLCPAAPVITELCTPEVPIVGAFLSHKCTQDCICSHGNRNNNRHMCTTNNGVPGNNITFCVCNHAENVV